MTAIRIPMHKLPTNAIKLAVIVILNPSKYMSTFSVNMEKSSTTFTPLTNQDEHGAHPNKYQTTILS